MGLEFKILNVDIPLFRILTNNLDFSSLEVEKMDYFLLDIGFTDDDLIIYKRLQVSDIGNICENEVDYFYNNVLMIFSSNKYLIMSTIGKSEVFLELEKNIDSRLMVGKARVLEIITEYIRLGLLSLVTNYHTYRISMGIFNIQKK